MVMDENPDMKFKQVDKTAGNIWMDMDIRGGQKNANVTFELAY